MNNYIKIKKEILLKNPKTIKNKQECYLLYNNGFFGNKVRTWDSYKQLLDSNYTGFVSMRSRGKIINRKKVHYNILVKDIPEVLNQWKNENINTTKISFSKTPPDNKLILQGEITQTQKGLFLLYSTLKKPMNQALKENEKFIQGLRVNIILKEILTPPSYDDLMEILNLFPNDVIEFSCYETNLGNLPYRNMIIWEVRGY
ncbi:hypothetical protein GOV12_08190 [Candidatus Pacearchaeota archaeon]|nr:hypothetical protein [Candidatus Pacearchaeota archaeon]